MLFRLKVKFRDRSFQRYRSHQKIFTELGDTAHQSWKDSRNFWKIPDPSTALAQAGCVSQQKVFRPVHRYNIMLQNVFYARYRSSIVRATSYLVGITLYTFSPVKIFVFLKFWFFIAFLDDFVFATSYIFVETHGLAEKFHFFQATKIQNPSEKVRKNENFKKNKNFDRGKCI